MNKANYLLFLIAVVLGGCQQNSLMQQLVEIDSTAFQKGDQQALGMLNNIVPEVINDERSLAYYWLLKFRTEIRLQKEIKSTEALEVSINYYKKCNDKGRLARAYGYKAYVLEDLGDIKSAILTLKKAEFLIKNDKNETELAFVVYQTLAAYNKKVKENEIALKYDKLALQTAYQLNNKGNIAYALMGMYLSYSYLGIKDSAFFYLEKCIPQVKNVPDNQRSSFYANIGDALAETNTQQAEDYLNMSIKGKPNAFAFRSLARIYYKRGERDKAKDMWAKALLTDNLYLKSEVMQAMYESQRDEGDFKSASETAMQIASLKDSIAKKEKEADIRGLQELFEKEQHAAIEKQRYHLYISLSCILLLLTIVIVLYLYYCNFKGKAELKETRENLEKYRHQLKLIEAEGKGESKEVERLTLKISELQSKQNALLQNGRERYEEIMAGGTTLKWRRNDFTDCIEYYRTIDAVFVTHIENDYDHLSAKYIFFALMEHIGKTDEELQRIMAIGQNTIRANRSRINQKKRE